MQKGKSGVLIMAIINNAFDLNRAQESQSYGYKCWYNYNYERNTMGISSEDIKTITQTWESEISNWNAIASKDVNAYEIEDDDWNFAYDTGKQQGIDTSGHNGNITGNKAQTGVTLGLSTGNAATTAAAGASAGSKAASSATNGAANSAAGGASKSKFQSWMVSAPLSLALAILYTATQPNKKEKDALLELQKQMEEASLNMQDQQVNLSDLSDEILDLSEGAFGVQEDNEKTLEEKQEEYETYNEGYQTLMARIEAGETLSDSDMELLESCKTNLEALGEEIATLQEEFEDSISDAYGEIEGKQDTYDSVAEGIANSVGLTDLSESYDKATKTMCIVEGVSQTLNTATGAVAAVQAGISFAASLGMNVYAGVAMGMGTAAAVMSGKGAGEQFKWAADIGDVIDVRKETQDITNQTLSLYDEGMDKFETNLTDVGDIEFVLTEGLEGVDEMELADAPAQSTTPESTETPEAPKKEKEEKPQVKNPFA